MAANNGDTVKDSGSLKERILFAIKPAIPSIVAVIAAIIILVVGKHFNAVDIKDIIKSIGLITYAAIFGGLMGALITLFVAMPVLKKMTNELNNLKTGLYNFIKNAVILKDHIIDEYSMGEIEKSVKCDEVWVITPDLSKDLPYTTGEFTFANIVMDNIVQRRICYKFVVPEGNDLRIKAIRGPYNKYPENVRNRLEFIPLDNDRWKMISHMNRNCIIYGPNNLEFLEVYFESPGEERHHWIRAANSEVEGVVANIKKVVFELNSDHV